MTKLKALIVSLVVGSSSVAMAAPATFSARAQVSVRVRTPAPAPRPTVVVRDHRVNQTPYYPQHQYEQPQYDQIHCGTMAITGLYNSEFGRVELRQMGDRIVGTFVAGGGGTIEGRIVGNQIVFSWQNTGERGRGVWFISNNGRINGTWGHNANNADGGAWTLTRMS
jgi:hypothetical protein